MKLLSTAERGVLRRVANDTTDTVARIKKLDHVDLTTLETAAYDVWLIARDENLARKDASRKAAEARKAEREARKTSATGSGSVTVH